MGTTKKVNIGNSTLIGSPKKKLKLVIPDKAIKARHLSDGLISYIQKLVGQTGNAGIIDHIFLTEEDYSALTEYKKNALYFIVPKEAIDNESSEIWHFGCTFPIRFSDNTGSWIFGDKFPIILV